MDDPVSREEKQVWFEKLVDAQNAISAKKHASYIGKTVKVLVDGESDDAEFPLAARTEGNRLVRMKGDKALIGTFAKAKDVYKRQVLYCGQRKKSRRERAALPFGRNKLPNGIETARRERKRKAENTGTLRQP